MMKKSNPSWSPWYWRNPGIAYAEVRGPILTSEEEYLDQLDELIATLVPHKGDDDEIE